MRNVPAPLASRRCAVKTISAPLIAPESTNFPYKFVCTLDTEGFCKYGGACRSANWVKTKFIAEACCMFFFFAPNPLAPPTVELATIALILRRPLV